MCHGGWGMTVESTRFESAQTRVRAAFDAIAEAYESLAAEDFADIPESLIPQFLRESRKVRSQAESVDVRLVAKFDRGGEWRKDACLTPASWLRHYLHETEGAARERLHVARLLTKMPKMAAAMSDGATSYAHVVVVARAADKNESRRATLPEADEVLAEAARRVNAKDLGQVIRRWAHTVDPEATIRSEQELYDQRECWIASTLDGAVALHGLFDPESGRIVMAALEAGTALSYRECVERDGLDDRTSDQRRSDALTDICAHYLSSTDLPDVGAQKPQVQVIVDLATLQSARADTGHQPGTLIGVGPISAEATRRISCDSSVTRIVMSPAGQPLDVGRSTRTVPSGLRTALERRDGGCRAPGCARRLSHCDAHHIEHWSRGGPTSLSNLILLCRHHHRLLHEGGFGLRSHPGGTLDWVRPDGTRINGP